ncbi:MAG: LacI family transcriptional regulator [Proteobacteria bacterium]|nr:LacI family transcriptional regulator [Pseudomonadota bacterium]
MSKVTMKDVARESGVSLATVSRALRNPDLVSVETIERIKEAVENTQYEYTKSIPANGATLPVIGVIVPSTICFGFAETIMGIQEASLEKGFAHIVGCTNYDNQTERALLEKFQQSRVAGLILTGFSLSNESLIREIIRSGVPTCVIWENSSDAEISYVGFDNFKAVYNLANHLISLGHRQIGILCGPFSKSDRPYRRLNGYRTALEEHAIVYDQRLVYEGDPTMEEGKKGMKQIMSLPDPPTAVLAAADVLALGALITANKMGLRIPNDVSIVGMDDIPYSEYCIPPLTTAHVPAYDMGYKSVEVIARNLNAKEPKVVHKCLDAPIVFRESTQTIS